MLYSQGTEKGLEGGVRTMMLPRPEVWGVGWVEGAGHGHVCVCGLRHFGGTHPLEDQKGIPVLSGLHLLEDLDLTFPWLLQFCFEEFIFNCGEIHIW